MQMRENKEINTAEDKNYVHLQRNDQEPIIKRVLIPSKSKLSSSSTKSRSVALKFPS